MKYSVNVPDEVAEAAKEAAAAEGVTPAEWTRRALLAALHPQDPTGTREDLERTREDLAKITAERDGMAVEIERLKASLAEKREECGWLRGQVALVNEQRALPEKAGPGRRPWWRFWGD